MNREDDVLAAIDRLERDEIDELVDWQMANGLAAVVDDAHRWHDLYRHMRGYLDNIAYGRDGTADAMAVIAKYAQLSGWDLLPWQIDLLSQQLTFRWTEGLFND